MTSSSRVPDPPDLDAPPVPPEDGLAAYSRYFPPLRRITPEQAVRLRGLWRRTHWLLAPLGALLGVGLHFAINVPPAEALEQLHAEARAESERDRRRIRRPEKPKAKAKAKPKAAKKKPWKPRTSAELEAAAKQYADVDFYDEPLEWRWARDAQSFVNEAIAVAERSLPEDEVEAEAVTITRARCRTVRCRFTVGGEDAQALDRALEAVRQLEVDGASLWRSFEVESVEEKGKGELARRVTITLPADDLDEEALALGADTAAEPKPAAPGVASRRGQRPATR